MRLARLHLIATLCLFGIHGCAGWSAHKVVAAPPIDANEKPDHVVVLRDEKPDGFAAYVIPLIELQAGRTVASYRVYTRFRTGPGSSFGAVGLYRDYFFADADGRAIGSDRRYLD